MRARVDTDKETDPRLKGLRGVEKAKKLKKEAEDKKKKENGDKVLSN